MHMPEPVSQTNLAGLELFNRGKVRDIYSLGDRLLIVATDRISCFDVVLSTPIPWKGKVLTHLTLFWLGRLAGIVPNHLVTAEVERMGPELAPHAELLRGRAMLVRRAEVLPVECVVRGYLAGSAWRAYRRGQPVSGVTLPPGLREADRLPEPVFTPSTKAASGHDEPISIERMAQIVGADLAWRMRELSVRVYEEAARYAAEKGIIISDTKFEWGLCDGELTLIDEVLTPDSSRFWPADEYEPGRDQTSFDKQFVRNYLDTLDWDKTPPGPELPDEIVAKTRAKYIEAYERLTGRTFQ